MTANKSGYYNLSIIDDVSGDLVSYQRQSSYDKGMFITASDGNIIMEDKNTGKLIKEHRDADAVDDVAFAEILRRLPYKADYKEKLKIFNLNGLSHSEVVVEVLNDNARISVPAGEFDTYHIRIEWLFKGQSAHTEESWISKGNGSKIVQSTRGGDTQKLLKDDSLALTESTQFQYKDQFKLTLPKRWAILDMTAGESKEMVLVPTPFESQKLTAQITSKYEGNIDWKKESPSTVAKWNIDFAKSYFKHYAVREETRKNFKMGNLPAYSFLADYKNGDQDVIEYRIIILSQPMVYQAHFHINKEYFESIKPDIDAMLNSLKIINP